MPDDAVEALGEVNREAREALGEVNREAREALGEVNREAREVLARARGLGGWCDSWMVGGSAETRAALVRAALC
jgi:hypothetical protein